MEKLLKILKKALEYIKLAALYLPKLIGILESKPADEEKPQE